MTVAALILQGVVGFAVGWVVRKHRDNWQLRMSEKLYAESLNVLGLLRIAMREAGIELPPDVQRRIDEKLR